MNSKDGFFTLEKFASGGGNQGNMAIAHFKDSVTGEARKQTLVILITRYRHMLKNF
ncbi:hypothetical protein MAL04_20545 (plasmid) [Leptospira noguchii]|nr:hypothetical protein MAL04_20545 [Leptospira noguchii]